MTDNEIRAALRHALGTSEFALVREALRAESERATTEALVYHDEPAPAEDYWRNDGWPTAWREMLRNLTAITGTDPKVRNQHENWVAKIDLFNEPCFCSIVGGVDTWLTGDALAAALRDYALEESCKK